MKNQWILKTNSQFTLNRFCPSCRMDIETTVCVGFQHSLPKWCPERNWNLQQVLQQVLQQSLRGLFSKCSCTWVLDIIQVNSYTPIPNVICAIAQAISWHFEWTVSLFCTHFAEEVAWKWEWALCFQERSGGRVQAVLLTDSNHPSNFQKLKPDLGNSQERSIQEWSARCIRKWGKLKGWPPAVCRPCFAGWLQWCASSEMLQKKYISSLKKTVNTPLLTFSK